MGNFHGAKGILSGAANWRPLCDRLTPLAADLALLPVGGGIDGKAPLFAGWQHHTGFTVPQLLAAPGARSVGARTGLLTGPLACWDFDGETSIDLACSVQIAPWEANTWHVHRDNDPFRLKVLFRPTPEQIAQLPTDAEGNPEFIGKTITKPAVKNAEGKVLHKGEALEVFFSGGRQVIVLGEHPSSSGNYIWPDGLGPEALAAPPDAWWTHAVLIARDSHQRRTQGSQRSANRHGVRRLDPCPICGRHSGPGGSDLWCQQTTEGLILCMPGSTFSAEQRHGRLRPGQVVDGWALVKRTPIGSGDALTFRWHQPKPPRRAVAFPFRVSHQEVSHALF